MTDETTAFDVRAYAENLAVQLRTLRAGGDPREWQRLIERGLFEAYRQREARGLQAMVTLVMGLLEVTGRQDEVFDELTYAINLAATDPDALALLHGIRANQLAGQGRLAEALAAARQSEDAAAQARVAENAAIARSMTAACRMQLLQPVDLAAIDLLVHSTPEQDALLVQSLLIPYIFACGRRAEAPLRLRAFRLAAEAFNHAWRLEDVKSLIASEAAIRYPLRRPDIDDIPSIHWGARRRTRLLRFRAAHLAGNGAHAEADLRGFTEAIALGRGFDVDSSGAVAAYHRARTDSAEGQLQISPPAAPTLLNLPSVLAGAEAVALAGSQALAARWLQWLEECVPPMVRTSLEWPVSRARITALLALRAGSIRVADAAFAEAVAWARSADYPCELALAKVQWAEFRRHHAANPGALADDCRAMRREGWDSLTAAGIEPSRFAYDVARLCAAPGNEPLAPQLTARELDVLALLAENLTYPVIAERLGIARGSVQVHAHNCYEKLHASGKLAAVKRARELGIL